MGYTLFEKIKIGGYAVGSAFAVGSSAFTFSSLVAPGVVPLIATATVLGTTYSLLNTAHTKLQETKKNHVKKAKIDKQDKDQETLKEKLQALKKRIQERLIEEQEKEEREANAEEPAKLQVEGNSEENTEKEMEKEDGKVKEKTLAPQKKTNVKRALIKPRAEELAKQAETAKQVAQAKKERAALDRKRARHFRNKSAKIIQLEGALQKLDVILTAPPKSTELNLSDIVSDTTPQKEVCPEKSAEIILPGIPSSAPLQSEAVPEKRLDVYESKGEGTALPLSESAPKSSAEKNTNTNSWGNIVYVGKRAISGCMKGATTAYTAIHTYASLASLAKPSIISAPVLTSVILLGAVGAIGNGYLGKREKASERQEEERDAHYEKAMQLLNDEHDSIMKLLDQPEMGCNSLAKTEVGQEKDSASKLQPQLPQLPETIVTISSPGVSIAADAVPLNSLPTSLPSTSASIVQAEKSLSLPVQGGAAGVLVAPPSRSVTFALEALTNKERNTSPPGPSVVVKIDIPAPSAPTTTDKGLMKSVPGKPAQPLNDSPSPLPSRRASLAIKKSALNSAVPTPRALSSLRATERQSLPTGGDNRLFKLEKKRTADTRVSKPVMING